MSTNFLSLSGELRNKIYNHALVCEEPIEPWTGGHGLALNLCLANKTISRESESLLYGQNCCNFSEHSSELIIHFFNRIGPDKAKHIQCVCIDFPSICVVDDDVSLENDSVRILVKIQSECTNLRTLITSLYNQSPRMLSLDALNNPSLVTKTLMLVDARFRAISSLQEIIVEGYEDSITADTRMKMENHAWIVDATEREEWDDRSFSDVEDDDFLDDYDDDDDYDVDNDSDFDRRALD